MFARLEPLSADRHGGLRLKKGGDYSFAAVETTCPLALDEITDAAACYPILFLRPGGGPPAPHVLLGFGRGESLAVGDDGRWRGEFMPFGIGAYPFALMAGRKAANGGDQPEARGFVLAIDAASPRLTKERGEPLFNPSGQPSAAVRTLFRRLEAHQRALMRAEAFSRALDEHGLLQETAIRVRTPWGRQRLLKGIWVVGEKRLNDLADEVFLRFRAEGWLPPLYAHLVSLRQARFLGQRAQG